MESDTSIRGGAFVASCRLSKTTSDSDLYHAVIESLLEDITRKQSLAAKLAGLKNIIHSVGAAGFTIDFDTTERGKSYHQRWRDLLHHVKDAGLIFIAIDDADYLSPKP